jgi:hypothetical protein
MLSQASDIVDMVCEKETPPFSDWDTICPLVLGDRLEMLDLRKKAGFCCSTKLSTFPFPLSCIPWIRLSCYEDASNRGRL